LNELLGQAVSQEDYEKAAKVREISKIIILSLPLSFYLN
jgi:protein-arginine kinase activator protein McsA